MLFEIAHLRLVRPERGSDHDSDLNREDVALGGLGRNVPPASKGFR